ncbi:MAG: biotin--[acetyl-CoA-carboxylase] ligase [Calditrichaeota bacterium]|nr:biotin--[acetyl-CoA-carboxylase] ligase [Calditrichota bacterium]
MRRSVKYDLLSENRIRALLDTSFMGEKIYAFWSVGSTNEFAYRAAAKGDKEGALVIAERQERGKGRLSRKWDSPFAKGLWFSVILRPDLPATRVGIVPYVASVSIAEAIEETYKIQSEIKWPNDLLYQGKKFCGILSEADFKDERINFVVLGIGINVNQKAKEWPSELKDVAISLRMIYDKWIDRAELLALILAKLEKNYQQFKINGIGEIMERWKARCPRYKKNIVIDQMGKHLEGRFRNIDEDGYLILRQKSGEVIRVSAGDVA